MNRRNFLAMFSGVMAVLPFLKRSSKPALIAEPILVETPAFKKFMAPKFPVYLRSPMHLRTEAGERVTMYSGGVVRAEDEAQLQYWRAKGYTLEDKETTAIRHELAAKWRMDSDLA